MPYYRCVPLFRSKIEKYKINETIGVENENNNNNNKETQTLSG
jgi:hypothetical protein